MDLSVSKINNKLLITMRPKLHVSKKFYEIEPICDSYPVKFYTATTNMKDFIGNITNISGNKCSVKGVFYGTIKEMHNVIIHSPKINKVGERVMVSEHITVDGRLELIATKERILKNDVNFINIGWSNQIECRYLRIDIYTGDCRELRCDAVKTRLEI